MMMIFIIVVIKIAAVEGLCRWKEHWCVPIGPHSNFSTICTRFRDIAAFVLQHTTFSDPTSSLPKISPCFPGSMWMAFGLRREKVLLSVQSFQDFHQRYRQTDRRTDNMQSQYRALHKSASRGKTCLFSVHFYRAMHYRTVLPSHVVRLSVCPSVRPSVTLVDQDHIWKSWKLIARTPSLFAAQRSSTYSQGNMGKFWGDERWVGKNGFLEHKSGNISETRKDTEKVTMGGL